ncbi:MAG TPA: aspartate aminotransferase family protein [Planctomycetota bacterium]|nr:aspartate aminotransferase family protein [Planctomycetota bacterium]
MTTQEFIAQYEKYVIGNYMRIPAVLARGEGSFVWDNDGRRYLDMFPGWGVNGLGHCHPDVVKAVQRQAAKLMHVANNYYNELQGTLAQMISERSFGGKCFFCNSGAEAVEAAIKLARIYSAPRYRIITTLNSFHGRTSMAMAATGQPKYHKGLPPVDLGFTFVPYNDVPAVEKAIDANTCAIMAEPIQGEGGVNVPADGYLKTLRGLCEKHGLLLILDEVTTGSGRTGKHYAYQHFGVEPDIMTLAKSMGGGLAVGAIETRPHIAEKLVPGTHASTFGGNPIACAGAIALLEIIDRDGLLEYSTRMGELLKKKLWAIKSDLLADVRGKGCLIGMELKKPGAEFVKRCMQNGMLVNCTHDTVIRYYPSMCVKEAEIDEAVAITEKCLNEER